jgi:hypothetical protein
MFVKLSSSEPSSSFFDKKKVEISNNEKTIENEKITENKKVSRRQCFLCKKKLSLSSEFICKCDNLFCSKHRFPDTHNCSFDHKNGWKKNLEEKNPQVINEKISKI